MPLADRVRRITACAQQFGERRHLARDFAGLVSRVPGRLNVSQPLPTACALRPVSSAARAGVHIGTVV
jgi:hypothetical protein